MRISPSLLLLLQGGPASAASPPASTATPGPRRIRRSTLLLLQPPIAVTTPLGPAPDFPSAIADAFKADPALLAMLGAGAAGSAPRKVWYKLAPQRTAPPWVAFYVSGEANQRVTRWGSLTTGTLEVASYAVTSPEARAIGERVKATLSAACEAGTILWESGRLMELWPSSPASVSLPSHGPTRGRVWREVRQFRFTLAQQVL